MSVGDEEQDIIIVILVKKLREKLAFDDVIGVVGPGWRDRAQGYPS